MTLRRADGVPSKQLPTVCCYPNSRSNLTTKLLRGPGGRFGALDERRAADLRAHRDQRPDERQRVRIGAARAEGNSQTHRDGRARLWAAKCARVI